MAGDASQLWSLAEGSVRRASLFLPLDRSFADFQRRFVEALSRLGDVYDWDAQQLAIKVLTARSDLLFIRAVQATRDGTIPLEEAENLISGAVKMLTSAARSTLEPKPAFSGRRPNIARDFMSDDVRMGHTMRGSFVITVLTRLDEPEILQEEVSAVRFAPEDPEDPRVLADAVEMAHGLETTEPAVVVRLPPFQRRVMATLATGVEAVREVTSKASAPVLDAAIARGLSADLCDSLSTMTKFEGLRSLDLTFQWGPAETLLVPATDRVIITRENIAQLESVSGRLKQKPASTVDTVVGQVTRLERAEEEDEGVVTVAGVTGRSTRRTVRLYLHGEDYDRAIRAHRRRQPVTATGQIAREGNGYALRQMTLFEVSDFGRPE